MLCCHYLYYCTTVYDAYIYTYDTVPVRRTTPQYYTTGNRRAQLDYPVTVQNHLASTVAIYCMYYFVVVLFISPLSFIYYKDSSCQEDPV